MSFDETGPLQLCVSAAGKAATFELVFSAEKAEFKQVAGGPAFGIVRGKRRSLIEWFNEDPPIVHFASGDFLVFNELFELPHGAARISFDPAKIAVWDWSGVDLKKEPQGAAKDAASIQRRVIERVLKGGFGKHDVVFDGDGTGEVADVVGIARKGEKIVVDLFHLKYSGGSEPGARIGDMYEVCGQAQKCIHWREEPKRMLRHLLHQEEARLKAGKASRFEHGDRADVQRLINGIRALLFEFRVHIVQPGLSKAKLAPAFLDVLGATETFLRETYSMPLTVTVSR